jgi:hypothetical protein
MLAEQIGGSMRIERDRVTVCALESMLAVPGAESTFEIVRHQPASEDAALLARTLVRSMPTVHFATWRCLLEYDV